MKIVRFVRKFRFIIKSGLQVEDVATLERMNGVDGCHFCLSEKCRFHSRRFSLP